MLQLTVNKRDGTSKDSKAPWHYLPTNDMRALEETSPLHFPAMAREMNRNGVTREFVTLFPVTLFKLYCQ